MVSQFPVALGSTARGWLWSVPTSHVASDRDPEALRDRTAYLHFDNERRPQTLVAGLRQRVGVREKSDQHLTTNCHHMTVQK